MENLSTYLQQIHKTRIITFLDKEIESVESIIDLHSNLSSDNMS